MQKQKKIGQLGKKEQNKLLQIINILVFGHAKTNKTKISSSKTANLLKQLKASTYEDLAQKK